jgi:metal-responsive CopG/Arc/MetJ family transcriptional regulator
MSKTRINVTLDSDLVDRLDAVRNRIPRSTMLNEALEIGLNELETVKMV